MTEKTDPKKLRKWIEIQMKVAKETISFFGESGVNSARAKGRLQILEKLKADLEKGEFMYGDEE